MTIKLWHLQTDVASHKSHVMRNSRADVLYGRIRKAIKRATHVHDGVQ